MIVCWNFIEFCIIIASLCLLEQLLYDCFTGDNGWPTWPRSRCAAIQHYLKKVPNEGEARGFVDFHGAKVVKLCCFLWADFNNQLQPPKRLESIHWKLRFHDWLFLLMKMPIFFQDLNVSFHTTYILCAIYLIVVCLESNTLNIDNW